MSKNLRIKTENIKQQLQKFYRIWFSVIICIPALLLQHRKWPLSNILIRQEYHQQERGTNDSKDARLNREYEVVDLNWNENDEN